MPKGYVMIYITGDKHGSFKQLLDQMKKLSVTEQDIMIILGDSGLNYYIGPESRRWKKQLGKMKCTFFIIRGNHEERPENINTYQTKIWNDGMVYYEEDFPNLLFAKDGESFTINDMRFLVIGGAYSIDKFYRLSRGYAWFADEQLTKKEMAQIKEKVRGQEYDYVLTHTAPFSKEPIELFLPGINQSTVDKSMEYFLEEIKNTIKFKRWYYGHYHADKNYGDFRLMFHDIEKI